MDTNTLERAELHECLLRFVHRSGEQNMEVLRRVRELQRELVKEEADEYIDGEAN